MKFERLVFSAHPYPARYALVALFVIAVGGVPILENPHSSLIMQHERMVWLVKTLRKSNILEPKQHLLRLDCDWM